jgi:hypothetical protein
MLVIFSAEDIKAVIESFETQKQKQLFDMQ